MTREFIVINRYNGEVIYQGSGQTAVDQILQTPVRSTEVEIFGISTYEGEVSLSYQSGRRGGNPKYIDLPREVFTRVFPKVLEILLQKLPELKPTQ